MFDILKMKKGIILINRVLNKEHFYRKKYAKNLHPNLVLHPFLIFVNSLKQPMHVKNVFEYKMSLKDDYQIMEKSKLDFFFCT